MRDFYRAAALGLSYSAYSQPFVFAIFKMSGTCDAPDVRSSDPDLPIPIFRRPDLRPVYNLSMPIPFAEYASRVQEHLERDWGIPVVTRDIPDPLTGDLDGAEIDVVYAITPELRLFLLGHLFGHTVQWNVN